MTNLLLLREAVCFSSHFSSLVSNSAYTDCKCNMPRGQGRTPFSLQQLAYPTGKQILKSCCL